MSTRLSAMGRATVETAAQGAPRLFLAATLAVALHIADDNFLHPAHGMSAADRLVSGTVPLVALAAGTWTYLRVRAGVRALITGLTGPVTGFLEAGYHLGSVGRRGDGYNGLLAGVAGVVLAEVVAPFAFGYYATHAMRATVPEPELGAGYEDVTLTTSDGLRLQGWYVPSQNGAAVIAFPGRSNPQPHARMLVSHGYGVLLFDRRGEGVSDGDGNRFGWGGTRDLEAALDFLEARRDVEPGRIGGLGLSVGGELMLQAAAEDPRLAAVVSEGAGTRTLAEELVEFPPHEVIRGFHTLVAKHLGVALFSNEPAPPSLVDVLPRVAPRPALLIWAPNGGNRETMNPLYQRLIGPSASQWPMDDVKHIQGLQTHPDAYERRVVGFFDHALLGGAGSAPRTGT